MRTHHRKTSPTRYLLAVVLAAPFMTQVSAADQPAPQSPYAGQQTRQIKALSEAETAQYLAGGGMGLARAAELNGYPGPKHVLELATGLALTEVQRSSTESVFADMLSDAQRLGALIVAAEAELDRAFDSGHATTETVNQMTREVARLQGELRAAHLGAHLAQVRILSAEQIQRYAELRGYGSRDAKHDHPHGH